MNAPANIKSGAARALAAFVGVDANGKGGIQPAIDVAGPLGGVRFVAFGDSIDAQTVFQPQLLPTAFAIPARQPSTAYLVGDIRQSNGWAYRCTTAGTSSSSTTPFTTTSPTDGTAVWTLLSPICHKHPHAYQTWVEAFSNGRAVHDLSVGYLGTAQGLLKLNVTNGGSGYVAPTLTFSNGATATLTVANGVITGAVVTNPGYGVVTPVLADASGTGAVIRTVWGGTGTFGSGGDTTDGMLARIADVKATKTPVVVVGGGRNDIVIFGISAAAVIANLKSNYEGLMDNGQAVVARTLLPGASLTAAQALAFEQVNDWIRAYCAMETWANPGGYRRIALADATPYWLDPTSLIFAPIGGAAALSGAVTVSDGTHPSSLGAFWEGLAVWEAIQTFMGGSPRASQRFKSMVSSGYSPRTNPRGNLLDPQPYPGTGTAVDLGDICTSNGNVYHCFVAGTTNGTAPSGTGTTTDGTAQWSYRRPSGISVGNVALGGTATAATGIVYTGTPPLGTTIDRISGTASGTVVITKAARVGQPGNAPTFAFSLGSGGAEAWEWVIVDSTYNRLGVRPQDRSVSGKKISLRYSFDVTNAANLENVSFYLQAVGSVPMYLWAGYSSPAVGDVLPPSAQWPVTRIEGHTEPIEIPGDLSAVQLAMKLAFDASGGVGTATATIAVNYLEVTLS